MIINNTRSFFVPKPCLVAAILALWVFQLWPMPANAIGEENPLKPIDTSSPRATLQSFLEFMNEGYGKGTGLMESYLASSNTYLTPEQMASIHDSRFLQESAQRAMDLSELPPAIVHESSRRLAIQLKGVLDRIVLPPIESIPDEQTMAKAEFKRWTIPGTEIEIALVKTGPRAGEYLFTPETLSRLPEFWVKVKDLPYKPGASVGWYDFSTYSPVGVAIALHRIVPPRWLLDVPQHRNRVTFLDQPAWRWLGILVVFGTAYGIVHWCFRLSFYWAGRAAPAGKWVELIRPLSIVIVTPVAALILADVLRVSSILYEATTRSL